MVGKHSRGPLEQLNVVEATSGLGGAFCGQVLAALGATVWLIEEADKGTLLRQYRLPTEKAADDAPNGAMFDYLSQAKRSIAIDVASDDGRSFAYGIVSRADVVVVDRWADLPNPIGESLLKARQEIGDRADRNQVWVEISPMGEGSEADARYSEFELAARSGWAFITGLPDRPPLVSNSATMHAFVPGAIAVIGVLACLAGQRLGTMRGISSVSVSGLESMVYATQFDAVTYSYTGAKVSRTGSLPGAPVPGTAAGGRSAGAMLGGMLETSDGYITALFPAPDMAELLVATLGADDGPEAASTDEAGQRYRRTLRRHTREHIFNTAQELRLPLGMVLESFTEIAETPQAKARNAFVEFLTRQGDPASLLGPRVLQSFQSSENDKTAAVPLLGEASVEEVRREFLDEPAPKRRKSARASKLSKTKGREVRPLSGIKVLDFTMVWAGPLCASILADLGAQVVKVEGPKKLDMWRAPRGINVAEVERPYEWSSRFNAINRGKFGIALDLTSESGRDVALRLGEWADIVMENFSLRVMPQLGLSYETLSQRNPGLVMMSLSGFGATGPWKDYVSMAPIADALSGVSAFTRYSQKDPPLGHGNAVGDPYAGLMAAVETLAALLQSLDTGRGRHLDISQLQCSLPFVADALIADQLSGDGQGNDSEWGGLQGRDIGDGVRRVGIMEPTPADNQVFSAITIQQDAADKPLLDSAPVQSPSDVLADPHLKSRNFFQEVDHPVAGRHSYPSFPFLIDGQRLPILQVGPLFGEHNQFVLKELLGLEEKEIAQLYELSVVSDQPVQAVPSMPGGRARSAQLRG